ncbi:MAG: ATP-binding protein [Patescibacteria group bacterium]|nr:ATP-binding protein [Patescibacteria group bacterium]
MNAAESFCSRWFNDDTQNTLLVIVGDYRTGKTHLAKAIYRYCSFAAPNTSKAKIFRCAGIPTTLYLNWAEAACEFGEKNFSVVHDCFKSDMLILDDIGAENDPWKIASNRLYQILSRREKKFTVITTNIQPNHWSDYYEGRIADRLMRNSVVVDLTGMPPFRN